MAFPKTIFDNEVEILEDKFGIVQVLFPGPTGFWVGHQVILHYTAESRDRICIVQDHTAPWEMVDGKNFVILRDVEGDKMAKFEDLI